MGRRRKSSLDEVASWPWQLGILAGILAFLLIRYGIGAWLSSDPSNDAVDRPWAEKIGIQFGQRAAHAGVLVLNDPDTLSQSINKLYFQSFPRDVRSNIHAGGTAKAAKITDRELRLAELIRPKLQADGMFLVGIDIIGDTILEVNVFSPGNLFSCSEMSGVNFAAKILESIERKLEIRDEYPGHFTNAALAVM